MNSDIVYHDYETTPLVCGIEKSMPTNCTFTLYETHLYFTPNGGVELSAFIGGRIHFASGWFGFPWDGFVPFKLTEVHRKWRKTYIRATTTNPDCIAHLRRMLDKEEKEG